MSAGGRMQARPAAAFPMLMATLVASAWAVLWLWSDSPYGRYLDHGRWSDAGLVASWCRTLPAGELLVPAALYASGWILMTAAMMLPTTLPLLGMFRRVSAARSDRALLTGVVIAGYLVAWAGFGVAAHLLDGALLEAARDGDWLVLHGWVLGAGVVGAAGAFQFSDLKYRCLEQCRAPFGFVASRWSGRAPALDAFRIGLAHGVFCVGCCWALMLLMFVVGTGNLGWMLALAAVMAAEKNLPWGRRLGAPLGFGLLAWAGGIVLANTAFAG